MSTTFQTLLDRAAAAEVDSKSRSSLNWFRTEAGKLPVVPSTKIMREEISQLVPKLTIRSIGKMYMFYYDPKHKDTLPYYDRFPLVFPFKMTNDGFYGLNMHYIHPMLRAKLMDAFLQILNNTMYDESTRVRMNYNLLSSSSKYRWFKPCVKRYLNNHVTSKFLYVDPNKWATALFLPTEKFVGARKTNVFMHSREIIYGK